MTDRLRANANLVDSLGSAARHGGSALADAPLLLKRVLEEGAWREFVTQRDELVRHARFSDFVTAAPLKGLGVEMATIERIVGTNDPDLLVMLREAERVGHGPGRGHKTHDDSSSVLGEGNASSEYLAQRLAAQHPEQYEAVKSGELSLNAAAVLAGIRPRRVSVRTDNAQSIVDTLERANRTVLAAVRDEIERRLGGD